MTQKKEYTWDDLVAVVGQDFSGGEVRTGADACERSVIRRFCEPIELACPLHYDDEVAKQHGYKGVVAPVSMVHQTLVTEALWEPGEPTRWPTAEPDFDTLGIERPSMAPPLPMPPTSAGFATDLEVEYLAPVYIGDVLSAKGRKIASVSVRRTSVGFGAFVTFEGEIHNQRGELVAKTLMGVYYYNPHPKEEEGR